MSSVKDAPPPCPQLEVKNLTVHYGLVRAIEGMNFQVHRGEIVTLIGANGAGKTTTLRGISGLIRPSGGDVLLNGIPIVGLSAHQIVQKKMAHVPEGRGIFLNLSVEENLDLGAWSNQNSRSNGSLLQADLEHVFSLFPRLKERRKQGAGTLSGGEQQMLAIGRALMSHPEILLLDEPSLGLAPQLIDKIFEIIVEINKTGTSVILVEQNALQALQIAHRGIVLETGIISHQDTAANLLVCDSVRKAYLGD